MTVVSVGHHDLIDLLGKKLSKEELWSRLPMMGLAPEAIEGDMLSFDVSPNRPDLYSVEGIARAVRGFLGLETGLPEFRLQASDVELIVDTSVEVVRPCAVGGILRDVRMSDSLVRSLIDLQEKLHTTVGRRRRKVAIGIHDLDKVVPPFTYKAVRGDEVRFVPLQGDRAMTPSEILKEHEKGREYAHILEGKDRYPIIADKEGQVLSFPPIINGVVTQITERTRNLFIDVTGTDIESISGVLNILSTSLYERGAKIWTVNTKYIDRTLVTPNLQSRERLMRISDCNSLLGLSLSGQEIVQALQRLRHSAIEESDQVRVSTAAYRVDIMHDVDLYEDVGIGHGIDRFPRTLPERATIGTTSKRNDVSEILRVLMIGYGYQEVMSLTVTNPKQPWRAEPGAIIMNPLQEEFRALRSSLVPSLLNVLSLNKHRDLPQRIFEIGDVIVNARNRKRVSAVSIHAKAGFTEAKSLAQSLLRDINVQFTFQGVKDENYVDGRCARILLDGRELGRLGEIHPRVLSEYGLGHPAIVVDLDLELLLERHEKASIE